MNVLAKSYAYLELTMRKIFLCFGLFCFGTSALAQQEDPDLILFNGKIFTSVVARPYVEALAIRGERIVATGDTKTIQAMAGPKTNAIDLHGGTAIPGINDAHHHFQLGPPEVDVDLQTMNPSWAQVKDGILAAVAKNPPNSLISVSIGFKVFGDRLIDRGALDQIAPHNPVSLGTFTGHGMILNTAAMRLYNISENQPDPMGGRFERDAKGRLTGTLREYAIMNIERAAADRVPDSAAIVQLRQQLDEEAKYGVTSIQELSITMTPSAPSPCLRPFRRRFAFAWCACREPLRPAAISKKERRAIPSREPDHCQRNEMAGGRRGRGRYLHPARRMENTGEAALGFALYRPAVGVSHSGIPGYAAGIYQEQRPVTASRLRQSLGRDDSRCHRRVGRKEVWDGRRLRFEHGDGIFADQFARVQQDGIIVAQNPVHLASFAPPGVVVFEKAQPLKSLWPRAFH